MTQQAQSAPQQTAPTTTESNGVTHVPTIEERAAAAFANDAPAETADGAAAPSAANPPPTKDAPSSPAASAGADPDAARKERLAALAKLAEEEQARVDAQARHRQFEDLQKRNAELEKRAAEAERMAAQRIDLENLTEEQFFDHARRAKVTPQRLGEWLREQAQNPEIVAARAASSAVDPKIAALEKTIAEQGKMIQDFLSGQQAASEQAEEERAFHSFVSYTNDNATLAPRSARFLNTFGPEEFRNLAVSAAAKVPPSAGPQAVLDFIEENLSRLAAVYAGTPAVQQQKPASSTTPAAAKAPTTVSNTLAQKRASVVDDEVDWAALPIEERAARLFR